MNGNPQPNGININRPALSEIRSSQKKQEKPNTHNWLNRRHSQICLKLGFTHDYRTMSFRGGAHLLACWNVWVGCVQPNLRARVVEYGNSTYRYIVWCRVWKLDLQVCWNVGVGCVQPNLRAGVSFFYKLGLWQNTQKNRRTLDNATCNATQIVQIGSNTKICNSLHARRRLCQRISLPNITN